MMQLTHLFAFLATLTLVLATALTPRDPTALLPDQPRSFPTFSGDYGGHSYEIHGTLSQVMAKLKERHPEVELTKRDAFDLVSSSLSPRDPVVPPLCVPISAWGWGSADPGWLNAAIAYFLNDFDNACWGPDGYEDSCVNLHCDCNNSVVVCGAANDDGSDNYITGIEIAQGIQTIMDYCTQYLMPNWKIGPAHGGQLFNTNNWNLIVKGRVSGVPGTGYLGGQGCDVGC